MARNCCGSDYLDYNEIYGYCITNTGDTIYTKPVDIAIDEMTRNKTNEGVAQFSNKNQQLRKETKEVNDIVIPVKSRNVGGKIFKVKFQSKYS